MPIPKDANVSRTTEFELWYTYDSITILKGCHDVEVEYIVVGSRCSQPI